MLMLWRRRVTLTARLNGCVDGCDLSYFLDTRQDGPCRRVKKTRPVLTGPSRRLVRTELYILVWVG